MTRPQGKLLRCPKCGDPYEENPLNPKPVPLCPPCRVRQDSPEAAERWERKSREALND